MRVFYQGFFYYLFIKTQMFLTMSLSGIQTDHRPGLGDLGLVVYTNCVELGIWSLIQQPENDQCVKIKLNCFFFGWFYV